MDITLKPKELGINMGYKEQASKKIRDVNFNELSKILDEDIKKHSVEWKPGYGCYYHSVEYWDRKITARIIDIPEDERIPQERLRQLLEGKVEPLLNNNCVECGRLVKHFSKKYGLD